MHLLIYNLCKPRGLDPLTTHKIAQRRAWIVILVWSALVIGGVAIFQG
mgnify:FL=1